MFSTIQLTPIAWLWIATMILTLSSVLTLVTVLVRTANDRGRTLKKIKDYIDAYDITKQSLMAQLRRLKQEAAENLDDVLHGNTGIGRVWRERQRQQMPTTVGVPWTGEGYTKDHDDEHNKCEMIHAACSYARMAVSVQNAGPECFQMDLRDTLKKYWPYQWSEVDFKPKQDKYRNLERAAALLIAEIDRRIREDEKQVVKKSLKERLAERAGALEAITKAQAEFDALPSSVATNPPPYRTCIYSTKEVEKDPADYIECQPDVYVKAVVYKNAVQKILDDPRRLMPEAWEQGYRQRLVHALNGTQTLNPDTNPFDPLRKGNQWCEYENGYNHASLVLGNLFVIDK